VGSATVVRFRGAVPPAFLIPHIAFMFAAMLVSSLAGIEALLDQGRYRLTGLVALILLAVGGLVLGPIVQLHAFGALWTGVPFGWDLTDNKVAVGAIVWAAALIANARRRRRGFILAAALVLLVVYSIPHSMMGSELDPRTGEVITGCAELR
jgi:hypothetical protein